LTATGGAPGKKKSCTTTSQLARKKIRGAREKKKRGPDYSTRGKKTQKKRKKLWKGCFVGATRKKRDDRDE